MDPKVYQLAKLNNDHDAHILRCMTAAQIDLAYDFMNDRVNVFYLLEDAKNLYSHELGLLYASDMRQYTYKEYYDMSLRYANYFLKEYGIKKNEFVAVYCTNSPEFLFIFMGLSAIGARPALINCNLTDNSLAHCVKLALSRYLFYDTESAANIDTARSFLNDIEIVGLDDSVIENISKLSPDRPDDSFRSGALPWDPAALIYTSGTTGLPKAAIVHHTKLTSGKNHYRVMGIGPKDRYISHMPLYHATALILCSLTCIAGGGCNVVGHKYSSKNFWSEVVNTRATMIQYVGEICRYLLNNPVNPLEKQHCLRAAFGTGLRSDIWDDFLNRFNIPLLFELYSATEGVGATWNVFRRDDPRDQWAKYAIGRVGPLSFAVRGSVLYIAKIDPDEYDEPERDPNTGLVVECPRGTPGELLFPIPDPSKVETIYKGYFHNEKESNKKLIRDVAVKGDMWFRTGDLVSYTINGLVFFHDRLGDTYRWHAENVSTTEVESALGKHPHISGSSVIGVKLPKLEDGRAGLAAIVLTEDAKRDDFKWLYSHCQKHLPKYAVPMFIRLVDNIELTGNFKIKKGDLKKEGIDADQVYIQWEGDYVPFTGSLRRKLQGGQVKL
ncbi:hypothetical protein CANCADRAFT_144754 [Tortispora caseinolytica NRRL Y-17796]|uniref:AMP-dependent synthetase/ligase domain-containing protein n=1 Tax=Tortispora caseinolytica NRRL Y-17796 TaxID=767744 RepID=A0A1E4T9A8_9ASCO|nr:hypothetical protein CANCADRAFT_144754 [Tortispora caseinolytica NRRL Y-17796]